MKPLDGAEGVKSLYAARVSRRRVLSERHYRSVRQPTVAQIRYTGSANSNKSSRSSASRAAPCRPSTTAADRIAQNTPTGRPQPACKLHVNPPSPYIYETLKIDGEKADRPRTSRPSTRHPGTVKTLLEYTKY